MTEFDFVGAALDEVRASCPLVHCITNYVTVNDCANALLAIGGSPIMSDEPADAAQITRICGGLDLNIGTLNSRSIEGMHAAGKVAGELGHKILLDPVGAGGTTFRTQAALRLLDELPMAVVRGNASEITCLAAHKSGQDFGVDSRLGPADPALASSLASHLGTTVAITGAVDVLSDGCQTAEIRNGCPLLTYVTGTGCMTTSLIASFAAVADPFTAAAGGILAMGIGGELALAGEGKNGPGTFHARLFDAFYQLNDAILQKYGKVVVHRE